MTSAPEKVQWGRFGALYLLSGRDQNNVASFPLDKPIVSMGREATNDIRVYYDWVSRNHCKIVYRFDQQISYMVPIGLAGVPFNKNLIFPKRNPDGVPLSDGDEIGLGKKVFRFLYAPGPRPTEASEASLFSSSSNRRVFRLSLVPAADVIDADPSVEQQYSYPQMPPESQPAKPMFPTRSPTKPFSSLSFLTPKKASSSISFFGGRRQEPPELSFQVCQDAADLIAIEEVDQGVAQPAELDDGRERIVERIRKHVSADQACVAAIVGQGYLTPQPVSSRNLPAAPRTVAADNRQHVQAETQQKASTSTAPCPTPQRTSVKTLYLPASSGTQPQPGPVQPISTPLLQPIIVPSLQSVLKHTPATPSRLKLCTTFSEDSPETPPLPPSPTKRNRTTPRSARARPIYATTLKNNHEKVKRLAIQPFNLSPIHSAPSSPAGSNAAPIAFLPAMNDVFSEYAAQTQGDQDIDEEVEVASALTPPQQRPQSILVTPGPSQTYLFRAPIGPTGMEIYDDNGNATGQYVDYPPGDPMDIDPPGWQDNLIAVEYVQPDAYSEPAAVNEDDVPIDPALVALSTSMVAPVSSFNGTGSGSGIVAVPHAQNIVQEANNLVEAGVTASRLETEQRTASHEGAEVLPMDPAPSEPPNTRALEILAALEGAVRSLGAPQRIPISVPKPSFTANNMPKPSIYTRAGQPPGRNVPREVGRYELMSHAQIIENLIETHGRQLPDPPTAVSRRASLRLAPQIQLGESFHGSPAMPDELAGEEQLPRFDEDGDEAPDVSLHNLKEKVETMRRLSDVRESLSSSSDHDDDEEILPIGRPQPDIDVSSHQMLDADLMSAFDQPPFDTILDPADLIPEPQDIHMTTVSDIPYDGVAAAAAAASAPVLVDAPLADAPQIGQLSAEPTVNVVSPSTPVLELPIDEIFTVEAASNVDVAPSVTVTVQAREVEVTNDVAAVTPVAEEIMVNTVSVVEPDIVPAPMSPEGVEESNLATIVVPTKTTSASRARKPVASSAATSTRRSTRKTISPPTEPAPEHIEEAVESVEIPKKRGRSSKKAVKLPATHDEVAEVITGTTVMSEEQSAAERISSDSVAPPAPDTHVEEHIVTAVVMGVNAESEEPVLVLEDDAEEDIAAPANARGRGRSTRAALRAVRSSTSGEEPPKPAARRSKRKAEESSHNEEAALPPVKAARTTGGRKTKTAEPATLNEDVSPRNDPLSQSSVTAVSDDIQMEDARPIKQLRRGRGKAVALEKVEVPVEKPAPARRTRGKAHIPETIHEVEPAVVGSSLEEMRVEAAADIAPAEDAEELSRPIKSLRKGRSATVPPATSITPTSALSVPVLATRSTRKSKHLADFAVPEELVQEQPVVATKRGRKVAVPVPVPAPTRSTRAKRGRPAEEDESDPLDLMNAPEVPAVAESASAEAIEAVVERGDNQPSPPKRRRIARPAKEETATVVEVSVQEKTKPTTRGRQASASRAKVVETSEDEVKENSLAPVKMAATRTRASSRATASKVQHAETTVARTTRSRARK